MHTFTPKIYSLMFAQCKLRYVKNKRSKEMGRGQWQRLHSTYETLGFWAISDKDWKPLYVCCRFYFIIYVHWPEWNKILKSCVQRRRSRRIACILRHIFYEIYETFKQRLITPVLCQIMSLDQFDSFISQKFFVFIHLKEFSKYLGTWIYKYNWINQIGWPVDRNNTTCESMNSKTIWMSYNGISLLNSLLLLLCIAYRSWL